MSGKQALKKHYEKLISRINSEDEFCLTALKYTRPAYLKNTD
jgi:hypothetical protein